MFSLLSTSVIPLVPGEPEKCREDGMSEWWSEEIRPGKKWVLPSALSHTLFPHVMLDGYRAAHPPHWGEVSASSNQSDFFHHHLCPETEKAERDDPGNRKEVHISRNQTIFSALAKWMLYCQSNMLPGLMFADQASEEWKYRHGYCPSKLCKARRSRKLKASPPTWCPSMRW